jgi:predicted RND superfamily exporter protein
VRSNSPAFIVSGKAMSSSISAYTAREAMILAPLAVLFNVVLAWLFFGNWKETLISLVPLLTGAVWLLAFMAIFNMPLNVVSIVAGIIASGVIVDYGIGITYEYSRNLHFGTMMAMTLSAASNVIGAGALLFALHPAFFSTGVAMVVSMVVGYLSSIIVIPSLCSCWGRRPGGPAAMKRSFSAPCSARCRMQYGAVSKLRSWLDPPMRGPSWSGSKSMPEVFNC